MRAHRDKAQEAVMPGAGVLEFGGGRHACQVAADRMAAAVAVLGSAPLAAAGDRPVNGRITFGRFDPALGFIRPSLRR